MFKLRNFKKTLEVLSWLLSPYSWRAKQSFLTIPSLLRTFENHAFHPYYKICSWKCYLCFSSEVAQPSEVCLPPPSPGCSATPTLHVGRLQLPCPLTPYIQFWLGLWLLFLSWNLFKGKIIYPVQVFSHNFSKRGVKQMFVFAHNCQSHDYITASTQGSRTIAQYSEILVSRKIVVFLSSPWKM